MGAPVQVGSKGEAKQGWVWGGGLALLQDAPPALPAHAPCTLPTSPPTGVNASGFSMFKLLIYGVTQKCKTKQASLQKDLDPPFPLNPLAAVSRFPHTFHS